MFIVLEGIDGCGKTTQADRVHDWLCRELGPQAAIRTREPGGWEGGALLRETVLAGGLAHPWSEWFLFMLDRCEHVARVIDPALRQGRVVVSDRYLPSTTVYQLLSVEGICQQAAEEITKMASLVGLPRPDLVFFLDIDTDTAMSRLETRLGKDHIEKRGKEFFQRAGNGYRSLFDAEGRDGSWVRLDATLPVDEVFDMIKAEIARRLEERKR